MATGPSHSVLPQRVDPYRFAQQGAELEAIMPSKGLNRLADAVSKIVTDINVQLQFLTDDQRHKLVQGKLVTEVMVVCQRCMETMQLPLAAEVKLAMVFSEDEAKLLPKSYDPWILDPDQQQADLYSVLEEELLLSLPIVATHDYACVDDLSFHQEAEEKPDSSTSQNPFKILEQLKAKD